MERGSGTYASRLSLRPVVVGGQYVQGISDGLVTSCLFKERVVATRRGREVQAELGVGGSDTDKARTGHGRGQEAWWQRRQRTHGLLSEGWWDGGS